MSDHRKFVEFLHVDRQRFDPVYEGKRISETRITLTSCTVIWSHFFGGEKSCLTFISVFRDYRVNLISNLRGGRAKDLSAPRYNLDNRWGG
jgi:hypothetical protein